MSEEISFQTKWSVKLVRSPKLIYFQVSKEQQDKLAETNKMSMSTLNVPYQLNKNKLNITSSKSKLCQPAAKN